MTNQNPTSGNAPGLPELLNESAKSPKPDDAGHWTERAIDLAYTVESLLRILSLAVDGTEISTRPFEKNGGGVVLDMAAGMTGELIEMLERGEKPARATL